MLGQGRSRAVGACALLCASVSLPTMAKAQLAGEIAPPERAVIDTNGVNVARGTYRAPHTDLTVGSGPGAVSTTRIYGQSPYQNARVNIRVPHALGATVKLEVDDKTYAFTRTSSGWAAEGGEGATLAGTQTFEMTLADGTRYVYDTMSYLKQYVAGGGVVQVPNLVYLSSIRRPDGVVHTLSWTTGEYCAYRSPPNATDACINDPRGIAGEAAAIPTTRLSSIASNAGYRINYVYKRNAFVGTIWQSTYEQVYAQILEWSTVTSAAGSNDQGGSGTLPSVTYATSTLDESSAGYPQTNDVTDATGRMTR